MPVFHTKTIESILEPVASQVSRLVILHEEAEDGNAMPDLSRPVQAVSSAVANLIKVGRETITGSDDEILKREMPASLTRVETASHLLEDAAAMLRADPYSGPARKKLIEGSRGILQGTSSLLLCFDESEVRKIIRECKRVLDYLAVSEVIDTMEDLVQFLKDLSPCLSKVSREVSAREKELTHQVHSEILVRCLEQVKILAPILICSMKVYIHIVEQGGKGAEEASENRNYLASRMSEEIQEIIRVLQLTTYDEDTSELDNLTVLKKIQNSIINKMGPAHDWLANPYALRGGVGEKALRQILENAYRVADRCLPQDAAVIRKLADDISRATNELCDLRQAGKGNTPQAEQLAREIRDKLSNLERAVTKAVIGVDKAGHQAAHTVRGRLEQACRWLQNPNIDDKGVGKRAIDLIIDEGKKVAEGLPGHQKVEILQLCDEVDQLANQFAKLCAQGLGNTPEAQEIARKLNAKLHELKGKIQQALVNRVVEDFMDVSTPLKQFSDAVNVPEGTPGREQNFNQKANNLQAFSDRASKTSRMVAAGGSGGNKRIAEELLGSAAQIDSLTPQLISAGRIKMNYPASKAADEHLNNLKQQYADTILRMRTLCDQATDPAEFIKASEEQIQKYTFLCEEAIRNKQPQKMVDNTSNIARLVNRVLLVAKQEADNSEDPEFIAKLNAATNRLEQSLPLMVQNAKAVAANINYPIAASHWREANKNLLNAVRGVRGAIVIPPEVPILPDLAALNLRHQEQIPPRPPLPSENRYVSNMAPPMRPPLPTETDDEAAVFRRAPLPNQPILLAAHGLHQEVRQWDSQDNELIAAAKRMAILMARLSELVHSDSKSSKRELIATAKMIAEASEDVTRLAKQLARECTDKRIRTNLLQVCERIPTIGTQLKILSTVKATMLGAQGSDEDREATEMLVGNAQNLMQSVKETVRAAEGASIKIRSDQTNQRLRWVRRQPWYQYA